jgi:AcrR family transcriptional regulator
MLTTIMADRQRATMNTRAPRVAYATAPGRTSHNRGRVDPRVRRTQKQLREAMIALIREKGFDAVTVQDIAERAEINRATFYLHYRDKDDLVARFMKDVLDDLRAEAMPDASKMVDEERTRAAIASWLQHAAANAEIYRLVLGGGMGGFALHVRAHMEELIAPALERLAPGGPPAALRGRAVASILLGAIGWWLEQKKRPGEAQMAVWLFDLLGPARQPGGRLASSGDGFSARNGEPGRRSG